MKKLILNTAALCMAFCFIFAECNAADIVLYSGDQIVVFYGSNSWAYTRLGRITDRSAQEMAELLGNGDVMITIEQERHSQ